MTWWPWIYRRLGRRKTEPRGGIMTWWPWIYVLFFSAMILIGIGMVFGGVLWRPLMGTDIRLEIVKAGLQLAVIAGLGGGVAFFLGKFESDRRDRNRAEEENRREQNRAEEENRREQNRVEEENRREQNRVEEENRREQNRVDEENRREQNRVDEYKFEMLREVIASYNKIKSVRRILRAFGFRFRPTQVTTFTPEQLAEFVTQMRILNEAQLSLERIKREIEARPCIFQSHEQILDSLRTLEKYIGDVVEDWEDHGESVRSGASSESFSSLKNLTRFLGGANLGFRKCAAEPLDTLVIKIRAEVLRGVLMQRSGGPP
jgi:hypothetical protein